VRKAVQHGVAVQDPREAPYAAAYAESIGAVGAAAANRELARTLGLEVPAAATARPSRLSVFFRSALFPLVVIAVLAWMAADTLRAPTPTSPRRERSYPSVQEGMRPWYVLADSKCFNAAQELAKLPPARRLELKVQTADDLGSTGAPAAGTLALIHLDRSLKAEAEGKMRLARLEARAAIKIFDAHGAPSCARAFG
jgi:hypothetical protein